ncbi:MAG: hypothetical protein J5U17_10165 [Candidatus Methanoperedens sp.]|nr:hypothetical protein [Candidatus Methanoperedens sp.]MCE8428670.1 hypothetical protein [Candidatus Methanoperedens sp.]
MRNTTSSRPALGQAPDLRRRRCLWAGEASFNILMLVSGKEYVRAMCRMRRGRSCLRLRGMGCNKARWAAGEDAGCWKG